MLFTRLPFLSSRAALLLIVTAGCGGSDDKNQQTSFETDPAVLRSALENTIISCQEARRECRANAQDAEQRAACSDGLKTCLQTAADKAQAAASALTGCRDEARQCAAGGTKLSECRSTYESCSEAAVDGSDADGHADAGSDVADEGSSDGDSDSDAGVPSDSPKPGNSNALPSLPSSFLDGGILAGLPKPEKCIIELRLCLFADPSSAGQCGDEARLCLQP
jgi:hypothetical protein